MINRFMGLLGYEKTLPPALINKAAGQLSKIYLFSLWDAGMLEVGRELVSEAEYIAHCIQNGWTQSESVDTKCSKCHKNNCAGQAVCPTGKTVYRIGGESFGSIISKHGYDFACFLCDNGLTTYEAVQTIIDSNRALYEKKPKTAILHEPISETRNEAVHKNDEEYNKWLHERITEYGGANLFEAARCKAIREVFLDILWQYDDYFDKKMLVLIDNIGNERCRNELIEHMLKNNRASVTAFELITGIKLPRMNSDRRALLNKTTTADYSLHPEEYSPHNPKERKEFSDRFYMWCIRFNAKYGFVECRGKLWRYGGSDFFIQKEKGGTYKASEGRTGLKVIDNCATIDSLKETLIAKLDKMGDKYDEHIKKALRVSGVSPLYDSSK